MHTICMLIRYRLVFYTVKPVWDPIFATLLGRITSSGQIRGELHQQGVENMRADHITNVTITRTQTIQQLQITRALIDNHIASINTKE